MVDLLSIDSQTVRRKRPNQVLVRFDDDTYNLIKKLARDNDITTASAVRITVAHYFKAGTDGVDTLR